MTERVLITGANGLVGNMLRPRLSRADRILRALDIADARTANNDGPPETMTGSFADPAVAAHACRDVDAIIHLAGISTEDSWSRLMEVNVDGTRTLLEAAHAAGVPRVILASSVHAVGARRIDSIGAEEPLAADCPPAPDTYYGCSKVAMEAIGSLYHSRLGIDVISVRIGACSEKPWDAHSLALWLSPDDAGRLFDATLRAPAPDSRLVWGVSHNTRGYVSLSEGRELGFVPADDSEVFAANIPVLPGTPETTYVGGPFMTGKLGEHHRG